MYRELDPQTLIAHEGDLIALLCDTVESGASIGFLPPLSALEAREYWHSVASAIREGSRVLTVAMDNGRIVGAVQLGLETRANGNHRAEVMKLMVHREARGRGIGRGLMLHAEKIAQSRGRPLLVLDTRAGDAAEQLYYKLGYIRAGVIPDYARSADGSLHDTVIMYRRLTTSGDASPEK